MNTIAYLYINPLLESLPSQDIWGKEVDYVYQDFGERQQLFKLLSDCQQQAPNQILIRRLEELGNTVIEICDRITLLESLGIEIIAIEDKYQSFQDTSNQQIIELLGQVVNNKRREILLEGHAKKRFRALPPPGKAPYGYRRGKDKYIIDKSTAPVVKEFFEQFILFGSLRGAVRYLEKRYGKKIAPSTGRKWLINPVYRGDLQYKNGAIIPNTHAPILDREEAAQIDRLLRRNSRLPPRTASANRSLAGLVTCEKCHLPLIITRVFQRRSKQEYLYLRCHFCPEKSKCKGVNYHEVLQQTILKICQELPVAVEQLNRDYLTTFKTNLKANIAQKENIISQLPKLEEQGILNEQTSVFRRYQLQVEIAQLETKLSQLPPENLIAIAKTVSLPQFWLDLSEVERRFYLREFIKRIEIVRLDSNQWDLKLIFIF